MRDGATLQMGIGGIPDSVLKFCTHHKDLGIHSEMVSVRFALIISTTYLGVYRPFLAHQVSDGMLDLVEMGAVTNQWKQSDKGLITLVRWEWILDDSGASDITPYVQSWFRVWLTSTL